MTISPGFTTEQIREYVYEYHRQRHGKKMEWIARQSFSHSTLRRWQHAVFFGDLERGLIPRESSGMKSTPRKKRAVIAMSQAELQAAHDAELAAMTERIQSLEASNLALGKAIGLLHSLNVEEPAETLPPKKPPRS